MHIKKNVLTVLIIISAYALFFAQSDPIVKKLHFTCITIHDSDEIKITKNTASSNLANFLSGYFNGINFTIENNQVKTLVTAKISMINKSSVIKLKSINDTDYLIETGSIEYPMPSVEKYKQTYTVRETLEGEDFWIIYQKLTVLAVQKSVKHSGSGIVIPAGELIVKIDENTGLITVTETFNIYEK